MKPGRKAALSSLRARSPLLLSVSLEPAWVRVEVGMTSGGDDDGSGAGSCWEPPAQSPLLETCHLSYLTASRKGLEAWKPRLILG